MVASATLAAMKVDAIFGALGRVSVRFRWAMLLVWTDQADIPAGEREPLPQVDPIG